MEKADQEKGVSRFKALKDWFPLGFGGNVSRGSKAQTPLSDELKNSHELKTNFKYALEEKQLVVLMLINTDNGWFL